MLEELAGCPIFKGLSLKEIDSIVATSQYKIKHYDKHSIVKLSEEKLEYLMIILSGKVQAQMIDYSGKAVTISELSASLPIAPAFIYARQNEMPVTVTALTEVSFIVFPKNSFTDMLLENRTILLNFLMVISDQSKFLSEKIRFLTFKNIKSKLSNYILKKSKQGALHSIELTETQQEMADYFGVARPSLARILSEMEQEGLISVSKRTLTIKNLQALKNLSK
ncbi:MAG: Crp/Fnr family transcriptional regulator [Candidatus Azobacteroides sp.]|nr:Crp/Fnr family transcriptional regulator [Candidatus Azobacteroides sp.]